MSNQTFKMVEVEDGVFKKVTVLKRNALARAAKQRWAKVHKEQAAEKKVQQKQRKQELKTMAISKERAKAGTAKYYTNKTRSEQIDTLVNQMLKQFVNELRGRPLVDYQVEDKESRAVRKEQLGIINNTIVTIRQLRELAVHLKDEEAETKTENLETPENVVMMDEARDLLKKAGLKGDM